MIAKVKSFSVLGIEAYPVEIEVDVSSGLPCITIVGLANSAVKESRSRIKSAIKNSGYSYPQGRITIKLARTDIKKEGSLFDLPIVLGVLASSGHIPRDFLRNHSIGAEVSAESPPRSGVQHGGRRSCRRP